MIIEIDRWDVEVWAAKSRRGEVCGIFGCPNKPTQENEVKTTTGDRIPAAIA